MNPIVHALAAAVGNALEGGRGHDVLVARDVAQVLGLDGLDRALGVVRLGSVETRAVESRMRQLLETCVASGSLEGFLEADRDLARLAVEHGAVIEGEAGTASSGTLGLLDALDDLPLDGDASRALAFRTRLTPAVTAALRATLDWLVGGAVRPQPIRLTAQDSALELLLPCVQASGLHAAAAVLEAVGGNLGPAVSAPCELQSASPWVLRVPVATARSTYLVLIQGERSLAVPCHAVLRLAMVPRGQLDASVRGHGIPVLDAIEPLASTAAVQPVILIGHGLKRAYLVADRLVWRLPATPEDAGDAGRANEQWVVTEDGARHLLLDPGILLERVEPLPVVLPPPEDEGRVAPMVSSAAAPEDVAMAASASAATASSVAAHVPGVLEPAMELEPANVAAAVREAPMPTLDPARATPLPLRALVAEDSIGARVFLARLLERAGFEVHAVETAGELLEALRGTWSVAFVDLDLPDRRGAELLADVRAAAGDQAADVVALVRDARESAEARDAGVDRALLKPYERKNLMRLLDDLGFAPEARP